MTMFSLTILLRSARIRKLRLSPLSSQKVTKGSREFPHLKNNMRAENSVAIMVVKYLETCIKSDLRCNSK